MSDSENEYEALMQRNLARKRALLTELGLNNLINEGKQLFPQNEERKTRTPVRRKSVTVALPSRRSARIQRQSHKVKYVKGFRGFRSEGFVGFEDQELEEEECEGFKGFDDIGFPGFPDQDSSDDDTILNGVSFEYSTRVTEDMQASESPVHPKPAIVKKKNSVLGSNCTDEEESSGSNSSSSSSSSSSSNSNAQKTRNDNEDASVEAVSENNPVVEKEVDLNKRNTDSSDVEYVVCTSNEDMACIINSNNGNGNENENEHSEDNEDTPWYAYNEKTCLEIIMNNLQTSCQLENQVSEDSDSDDDWSKYENVMFFLSTSGSSSDSDESDVEDKVRHGRKRISHPVHSHGVPTLSCDDVTEEMLAKIARRSSSKVYDAYNGTTCHQCRQKTFDTKTVCRSGRCVGVRGMFCGICLPRRYGEQVADALKNPSWECPVCRGMCNCSFCRAREGKNPTGIMYPEARQHGYDCVAEYLKDKDKDKENRRKPRTMKILATNGK